MAFPKKVLRILCFLICLYVLCWFYNSEEETVIVNYLIQDCPSDKSLRVSPQTQRESTALYDSDRRIRITKRKFVESENKDLFILGAVAKNSTRTKVWDKIAVYGQWKNYRAVKVENLRCCFRYGNGKIFESKVADYNIKDYERVMLENHYLVIWHITCDRPSFFPEGVSITRSSSCKNTGISYLEPYYAMKQPDGYLIITTKLAYGTVDPEIVVGFLEAVKYLGVNKVITYVYKTLELRVKHILKYYAQIGLLDYHTIELADEQGVPRKFPPLYGQYMNDEWLVKRDALERNIGSTYFGIFDMDEYLVPSNNRSLQKLLTDLRQLYPTASHFHFKNIHFLTNDKSPLNCSLFHRHVLTSPVRYNLIHQKMLILTDRIDTKTIHNHGVQPLNGFNEVVVSETEAFTSHYGKCKRKFDRTICRRKSTWIQDTRMVHWAEKTIYLSMQNKLKLFNVSIHSVT